MRAVLGLCLAALALSGCGQKGPLYLPDKKPKVVVTAEGAARDTDAAAAEAADRTPTDPSQPA